MPNYKTHSIHGLNVIHSLDTQVNIDEDDLKTYCFGFDTLILTDYKLFQKQHCEMTKDYFETLINEIKRKKLQDNGEVMAFLYGQVDHFVLDIVFHPFIYYFTKGKESDTVFNSHALMEMWMDDYFIKKCDIDNFKYMKQKIDSRDLKELVSDIYKMIYDCSYAILKYNLGINSINMLDSIARKKALRITPIICKMFKIGDITYSEDLDRVIPLLNLDNGVWFNPETLEERNDSVDDLWEKSIEVSLDVLTDINNYLYGDKPLNNRIITGNLSANTGLPCEEGQHFRLIKKY